MPRNYVPTEDGPTMAGIIGDAMDRQAELTGLILEALENATTDPMKWVSRVGAIGRKNNELRLELQNALDIVNKNQK